MIKSCYSWHEFLFYISTKITNLIAWDSGAITAVMI
jgi:hypothetical protein